MIVEKFNEIISFKQCKCFEKFRVFKTQKQNSAKIHFKKDFYKSLENAFYGKMLEKVRNRVRLEII